MGDVAWQAAGHAHDDVEAEIKGSGGGMGRKPGGGGTGDAPAAGRGHRLGGFGQARALLDLDEGDEAAAAGDQVDLADRPCGSAGRGCGSP